MSILIIGCRGQLGRDMVEYLNTQNIAPIIGIDYPDLDVSDPMAVSQYIMHISPKIIINCAAYTAVDICEQESQKAYNINGYSLQSIGKAANVIDATVVHYGTDYIFDGLQTRPYIESDIPNPKSVYGKSKLLGEKLLAENCSQYYILRIAWLYGYYGNNFIQKILQAAKAREKTGESLKVVNDQIGAPTWTQDVCRQTLVILQRQLSYGIYHTTSEGRCSWFDFATQILHAYKISVPILPCSTAEFPRPAYRPPFSVLDNARLKENDANIMPDWYYSFQKYVSTYTPKTEIPISLTKSSEGLV